MMIGTKQEPKTSCKFQSFFFLLVSLHRSRKTPHYRHRASPDCNTVASFDSSSSESRNGLNRFVDLYPTFVHIAYSLMTKCLKHTALTYIHLKIADITVRRGKICMNQLQRTVHTTIIHYGEKRHWINRIWADRAIISQDLGTIWMGK